MDIQQIILDHVEIADRHGLNIKAVRLGYDLCEQLDRQLKLTEGIVTERLKKYFGVEIIVDTNIRDVMEFIYDIDVKKNLESVEGLLKEAHGEIETALEVIRAIRK